MRTSEEYVEKLYGMRKNVYMDGKLVARARELKSNHETARLSRRRISLDAQFGLGRCKNLKYGLHV